MQNVRSCGSDWHLPVTKARRLRGWEAFVTTLALAAIALVLLALPSRAEEEHRERIPGGCREPAGRVGARPTVTHAEATRAIACLSLMSSRDPAVLRCRAAMLR